MENTVKRYYFAYLTFTPGVEEDVDVFLGVLCGNAFCTPGADRELVFSDDSIRRWIDWQLDAIGILLHHLGFPAQVLQLLHKRNDDVRALRHQRQRTYKGKGSDRAWVEGDLFFSFFWVTECYNSNDLKSSR